MLFPDVNVYVGAQRTGDSNHSRMMRAWLQAALTGREQVGVSELALSSMVRIVTNPRIFAAPSPPADAMAFAEAVLSAPATIVVRPGPRHWSHFSSYVLDQRLRANDIPDAYYAALAAEQGATFVTADGGFKRFGLRTIDPTA